MDWSVALQAVRGPQHDVRRLVEGVNRHHQQLHPIGKGKLPHLGQVGRVVGRIAVRDVSVDGPQVRFRHLERLEYPLAHRYRGHDDDELAETVAPEEVQRRAEVDIGLAGARLHLDREVGEAHVLLAIRRLDSRCDVREAVVRSNRMLPLDGLQVGQQGRLIQVEAIGHRSKTAARPEGQVHLDTRLPLKQPRHGGNRLKLVVLVGVKAEFHDAGLKSS